VFISYSHEGDTEYVEDLAKHLNQQGIAVWFDREIISGDRWASLIQAQIDSCVAMIVVMSPAAENSVWVNREIVQAEEMGKPIHPLLLKGRRFFRLADVQYEDVTEGRMPPLRLVDRLRGYQNAITSQMAAAPLAPDVATLKGRYNEAVTVALQGQRREAIKLIRRVLADRVRILGADHPDTIMTWQYLAGNIAASGDYAEAIRMYRELLPIQTRVLGADDPETLKTRSSLAFYIGTSGDPGAAAALLRDLLPDRIRVLGPDHYDIEGTRRTLVDFLIRSGNRAEAEKVLREISLHHAGSPNSARNDNSGLMQRYIEVWRRFIGYKPR
jgi:tetratricopeptide (TPR) repeat protein